MPGTDGNQALGRITVRTVERTGLLVTNGKVEPRDGQRGQRHDPADRRQGGVRSAAATMEAATSTLNMTQLFFGTPDFEPVTADEHPKLVFAFGEPAIVPLDPLPAEPDAAAGPAAPGQAARAADPRRGAAQGRRCASSSTSHGSAGRRGSSGWPS